MEEQLFSPPLVPVKQVYPSQNHSYFHITQGVPGTASASSFWVFDVWLQPPVDKAANGSLPLRLLPQQVQHSTSKRRFWLSFMKHPAQISFLKSALHAVN